MNGYTDNDFIGRIEDTKSTSEYVIHFGIGVVSWESKKQPIVTILLVEVEYVAMTLVTCQAIWMRNFLIDLF